jgi:methylase of polypeptide subunit release factors
VHLKFGSESHTERVAMIEAKRRLGEFKYNWAIYEQDVEYMGREIADDVLNIMREHHQKMIDEEYQKVLLEISRQQKEEVTKIVKTSKHKPIIKDVKKTLKEESRVNCVNMFQEMHNFKMMPIQKRQKNSRFGKIQNSLESNNYL